MTNRNYFIHRCLFPLNLGDFSLEFIMENDNSFCIHNISYRGCVLPLSASVALTKRSIITSFMYDFPSVCKFSPYELREWCPAIFLPYTNYLHWQKFLRIALEIFVESNPNILSSCACTL